jgi:hypothetical protein
MYAEFGFCQCFLAARVLIVPCQFAGASRLQVEIFAKDGNISAFVPARDMQYGQESVTASCQLFRSQRLAFHRTTICVLPRYRHAVLAEAVERMNS